MRGPSLLVDELRRLAPFAALTAFAVALVAFRIHRTSSAIMVFLPYNLALAAIPLAASTAVRHARRPAVQAVLLAVWLLFLPNAPYLLTDLQHLKPRPPVPLWYDLLLLLACAGAGLALGYRSLLDVEEVVAARLGAWPARAMSVGALLLCGYGIYLGRFLRLNSWDAVLAPGAVLGLSASVVVDPLGHLTTWAVSGAFGVLLVLGYAAVRALGPAPIGARRDDGR